MKTRELTLPRGSGPALRVLVISVNSQRRRRVVQKLIAQGMAPHQIRTLFGLNPARFRTLLSKLETASPWSKVFKLPEPSAPVFWSGVQLSLFAEVPHDSHL